MTVIQPTFFYFGEIVLQFIELLKAMSGFEVTSVVDVLRCPLLDEYAFLIFPVCPL